MNDEQDDPVLESPEITQAPKAPLGSIRYKLTRRGFLLRLGVYGGALLTLGNGLSEPGRLAVRRSKRGNRGRKVVHITDLHYKGRRAYLEEVIATVNAEKPDAVLCTGDFIEHTEHLDECLELLADLNAPLYAVPGNHDYGSGASFADLASCCEATGGRWLGDAEHLHDGWLHLKGMTDVSFSKDDDVSQEPDDLAHVLLCHYPAVAHTIKNRIFDLILAGHSHGGQIRLPGIGALLLPRNVGGYDLGWFDLPCGALHVSAGVGTYFIPIRFFCRPDVAVIEL